MTKTAYHPTETERQGSPQKFLYELRMFIVATNIYALDSTQRNAGLKNVTIESVLIHVRNLYEFFYSEESSNDNIIARHFIRNTDGTPWKPSASKYLASCKYDINKALSHLTYTRVTVKHQWDFNLLRKDIELAYSEFLALLPKREQSRWQV